MKLSPINPYFIILGYNDGTMSDDCISYSTSEGERKQRVLVVDDEPNIVRRCRAYIERAGYLVSTVANGADALEALRKVDVDIVVTDVLMPVMSGFELIHNIRNDSQYSYLPLIIMTQRIPGPLSEQDILWQQESLRELSEMFQAPVLGKPFNPVELVGLIDKALGTVRTDVFLTEE